MSKKKKTLDELLEEALVPEDEQPYEIPESWVWTRLGALFEHVKLQKDPDGSESYIGLEHLQKGGGLLGIGAAQELKSKKVVFQKGDLLYGKLRPYLNKHCIAEFDGVASTDILVYRVSEEVYAKFINNYLNMPFVIEYANSNSNGINLPRVSPGVMNELPIPLPPLHESKKIVNKIEILFAKIDEAEQLIESVRESSGLRKETFLNKVFRGELTEKWRRKNLHIESMWGFLEGVDLENKVYKLEEDKPFPLPNKWIWVKLGDIATLITKGTSPKWQGINYTDNESDILFG